MKVERGLLDAAIANPDDDALRLVYADWLEEQGDERSELIRVQCLLSKLPPFDHRRGPLNTRIGELLQTNRRAWLAPIKTLAFAGAVNPFRRGFLEHLVVTVSELPFVQDLLIGSLPTVRSLAVVVKEEDDVPNILPLSRVTEWTFLCQNFADDDLLGNLVSKCCGPDVRSLRWRADSESQGSDGNGEAILRGIRSLGPLPHLVELELSSQSNFSGAAMELLIQSPWRDQLRALHLGFSGWQAEELVPLLVAAKWRSLESLDLSQWHLNLSDHGQQAILIAPLLKQLRHLGWSVERESAMRTLERLASQGQFPFLTSLSLGALREDQWRGLESEKSPDHSSPFPALKSLDLYDQPVGTADLRYIQTQPWLANLRHLSMYRQADQRLTGLERFFKEASLRSLTALECCFFQPETVLNGLEKSELLSQLQYLNLLSGVSPSSLTLLTASPQAANLRFLGLGHSDLSVDDVRLVLHSPHMENLVYLDVSFCRWETRGHDSLLQLKALETSLFSSAPPALAKLQYINLVGVERLRERFFVDDWYRNFDFVI